MTKPIEEAILGGGCFWCTEAVFQEIEGVTSVDSGYSGGITENPTYEEVCTGSTGHAEVVRITFDPSIISYREILDVFFSVHDPTSLNRQGDDVGTQYRSVIFYTSEEQKKIAEQMILKLSEQEIYKKPVVTKVEKFMNFYSSEDYHKNYFKQNGGVPYCKYVINPKIEKFKKNYNTILKR